MTMTATRPPAAPSPIDGRSAPDAEPHVEGLDRIQPLVGKWTGGMASLWTYSVSHAKLVVRMIRPTVRGNLHLSCYDCRRVSAPTHWGGTNVQISAEDTPEGRRFVIRDEANKVEIRCGYLTAQENVEPIY